MNKESPAEIKSFILNEDSSVSKKAVNALDQDGVVCLRQAFSLDWLKVIEQGIELALAGASTDVDIVKRKKDKGSFSVSSGA